MSIPKSNQSPVRNPHWHKQPRQSTNERVHRTTLKLIQHAQNFSRSTRKHSTIPTARKTGTLADYTVQKFKVYIVSRAPWNTSAVLQNGDDNNS